MVPPPPGSCCGVSLQAEYEVTPDEKRKECGQELLSKYFNPKVLQPLLLPPPPPQP